MSFDAALAIFIVAVVFATAWAIRGGDRNDDDFS
jgi:hypothetical protein